MPLTPVPPVRGLLLAAGAGRRMGGPKALLRAEPDGPTFAESAIDRLLTGGCDGVTVVVGADAAAVAARVAEVRTRAGGAAADVDVVPCPDWAEGMGASLRAGLTALAARPGVEAVLVSLVDLPDVGADVVARLLGTPGPTPAGDGPATDHIPPDNGGRTGRGWRAELRRAAYRGVPGHPALIGRDLWDEVVATAVGDRGAREVYRTHPHRLVECGDLATGRDVDTRADLHRPR